MSNNNNINIQLPPQVIVEQEFQAVEQVPVVSNLPAVVVGPAKAFVELLAADAAGNNTLNTDAYIALPGGFIAKEPTANGKYTGLNGLKLALQINNKLPVFELLFSDPSGTGLTPETIVSQIRSAKAVLGITSFSIVSLGDSFRIRTLGTAENEFIKVTTNTAPEVAAAFGIGIGKTYAGTSTYKQSVITIPSEDAPNPDNNLEELVLEKETIRVFLSSGVGTNVKEAKKDQSFLRSGVVATPAITNEGSVDLTSNYPVIGTETLVVSINGGEQQIFTANSEAGSTALLNAINSSLSGVIASLGSSNGIVLTTTASGADSSINISATSTILGALGITAGIVNGVGIKAIDDGDGNAVTNLIKFTGQDFTASATVASLTASAALTSITEGGTLVIADKYGPQTITFSATTDIDEVVDRINAVMGVASGGDLIASNSAGALKLDTVSKGAEAVIKVVAGTALSEIDPGALPTIIAGAHAAATPHPVQVADTLYINGVIFADVLEVAPAGQADTLRIDNTVVISENVGDYFYIIAKNLDGSSNDRPTPDLVVDSSMNAIVKNNIFIDTKGEVQDVKSNIYYTYRALRLDVSPSAETPRPLVVSSPTDVNIIFGKVTEENPLALALSLMTSAAPGTEIYAFGIDEISEAYPQGTPEAYQRAFEALEPYSSNTYAIAPLTFDETVKSLLQVHVQAMSEPETGSERTGIIAAKLPTRRLNTIVGSGADGEGTNTTTFDTQIADLPALLQNAGVSPVGTIPVSAGLFLDIGTNGARYSVKEVTGSSIKIRTTAAEFLSGENDDAFYAEQELPLPLVSEDFSVMVRGDLLLDINNNPDKTAQAETLNAYGQQFNDRRMRVVYPEQVVANVDGIDKNIEGYYMAAILAAQISYYSPSQALTRMSVPSRIKRALKTTDYFNNKQLNIIAGGGINIFVNPNPNTEGSVQTRMELTTDMTDIKTRTGSVTRAVDYTAKTIRLAYEPYAGKNNITPGLAATYSNIADGIKQIIVDEYRVIAGLTLSDFVIEENSDRMSTEWIVAVFLPNNVINIKLVIQ